MITEIMASEAYRVNMKIMECNYNVRANFLHMAKLLVQVRDERLYFALDCPTFESYLGSISAEGTRGWLYKLIRAWEKFSRQLGIPDQTLIAIGPSKLDILAPMIPAIALDEGHRAEWLGKAANLSKSDLINEVRICQGKSILSSLPAERQINPGLADLVKYGSYTEYAKYRPCILCGAYPVDIHHWPLTKGAGAKAEHVIPLCRACHTEFHQNPLKWLNDYSRQWAEYFYGLILKIWDKP